MRWLRSRALRWSLAVVVCLGLFVGVFVMFAARADHQQRGDARSTHPDGNAAIAQLLRDEGVTVRPRSRLAPTLDSIHGHETVVVTSPRRLDASSAQELLAAQPALLVLVTPDSAALERFGLPAEQHTDYHQESLPADCSVPAAQRAETIWVDGGYRYTSDEATEACFAAAGQPHAHLGLTHADTGTRVLLVGTGFLNRDLQREGNAAYAMNLLGSQPDVLWLVAPEGSSPLDDAPGEPGLLPDWWIPAVVQVLLAVAVIAVWRGRRLGPLMSENLPVVIPAAETVEGHGRLYDRHHASERAAESLRAGTRDRLGRLVGHAGDPQALSQVVADRTGRDVTAVHWLLTGPPPTDDDQLHALNQQLTALEQEARQP